jgi:signal transduction histidine kinase
MKLLTKINRTYFKYGLLVFLLADIAIILASDYFLKTEIDEELQLEAKEIVSTLKKQGSFQNIYPTALAIPVNKSQTSAHRIKDTMIYDPYQKELAPFREYSSIQSVKGQNYQITTRHMLMEFDDILALFTTLISIALLLIFLGFLFFVQKLNTMLWGTFNKNVIQLKSYSFSTPSKLNLSPTGIDEFDELNLVLSKLSNRLEEDYIASKEFSANAAHEFQTPLAIIRNKCENLFSDPNLNESTVQSLREIYLSTDRLSGITKALLLLAKIDQGQFHDNQTISINQYIKTGVATFEDIIQDRNIVVSVREENPCNVCMDKRLTDLMIQNLLTNAIKNCPNGKDIQILLEEKQFSISNYGDTPIKNPEFLFNRFYKESQLNNSSGIGLAIVKKIVDHYEYSIQYTFRNKRHIFSVDLNNC